MKNHLFAFITAISLLGIIQGCRTDDTILEKPNPTLDELQEQLKAKQPEPQAFSISNNSWQSIEGQLGTRIAIPANAFVDQQGNPVTGNVEVQLTEIFGAGDMIFANMMTESNGQILASGGEFILSVEQNGQRLELAAGTTLDMYVPTNNPNPQMGIFSGVGSGTNFTWQQDPSIAVNITIDSITQTSYYTFGLDTLYNFINCDYFFSDPRPLTDVEIKLPVDYNTQNTFVYVHIPSINSIVRASTYYNGSYWISGGYQLPVGLNVVFIGIYYDGTNYGYAMQNATIVNNHAETLAFQPTTLANLHSILQNL